MDLTKTVGVKVTNGEKKHRCGLDGLWGNQRTGCQSTKRKGWYSGEHVGCSLELKKIKVLPQDLKRPLAKEFDPALFTTDEDEFFATPGIDIVIEAIGGEHPAFEYHQKALSTGKSVVTSNKEVIAKRGADLLTLAQKNNVSVRYEASVGGGIPLISPFMFDLVANKINGIYAIINGTTNYILTRMAKEGTDFIRRSRKLRNWAMPKLIRGMMLKELMPLINWLFFPLWDFIPASVRKIFIMKVSPD